VVICVQLLEVSLMSLESWPEVILKSGVIFEVALEWLESHLEVGLKSALSHVEVILKVNLWSINFSDLYVVNLWYS
jgi:hypothetical protein